MLFLISLVIFIISIILYFVKIKLNEHYNLIVKQQNFKNTLEDMKDILKYNNIPFHLYFGTALGAIREQRFITYDTDIDIAIFKKDIKIFNKLGNIITTNKKFKLKSKLPMNSKNIMEYSFIHKKTNVSIDIFLIIEKNNKYKFFTYYGLCNNKPNKRCEYTNSKYALNDILWHEI